jgi:valyl-tRNA synthetase
VLVDVVKLLHPFVPFITEEIWQVLGQQPASVSIADFPVASLDWNDDSAEREMAVVQNAVRGVRTIRAELNVPHTARPDVFLATGRDGATGPLERSIEQIQGMTGSGRVVVGERIDPPDGSARQVFPDVEVFVSVSDLIDIDAERSRLQKDLDGVDRDLANVEATLANDQFIQRAPRQVVNKERGKRDEYLQKKQRLEANLNLLGG